MISVIIPTLNAEATLARTLAALVPAAAGGLVRDVVLVDGGSSDRTLEIADDAGCTLVHAARGRGSQLAAGPAEARGDWLLFLHADTVLAPDWADLARRFIAEVDAGSPRRAAAFRFALDAPGPKARLLELAVAIRCAVLALPYGDQGLLMPRQLYAELGGFKPLPLMEDVDMVRRIGRRRLAMLPARALTSAVRYRRGTWRRSARNLLCLGLYFLRVPPRLILRLYG